jgi:hypothetical protein
MTGLIIITSLVFAFALTFAVAAILDELASDERK